MKFFEYLRKSRTCICGHSHLDHNVKGRFAKGEKDLLDCNKCDCKKYKSKLYQEIENKND